MIFKKIIVLVLLFANVSFARVNSSEFRQQVQEHRERVLTLSIAIYQAFPEHFQSLYPDMIKYYMKLHDLPKVVELKILRQWGYTHPESISLRLAHFHGRHLKRMNSTSRQTLKQVIKDLNEIEGRLKKDAAYGLTDQQVTELKNLEHWVDVTDVGISRREELGINGPQYDGAIYLQEHNDEVGAEVSRYIEDHYWEILGQKSRRTLSPEVCNRIFAN